MEVLPHLRSAHDNGTKSVGIPNCLAIARSQHFVENWDSLNSYYEA